MEPRPLDFAAFFRRATGCDPHPWQRALADASEPASRLLRVPTGLGKTAGTVLAWAWHRLERDDGRWPRRLVFCLPMRVLVEQTEAEVRRWLERLELQWDGRSDHAGRVGVHALMGGADAGEWHLHPERCAVLIGTQDMLLSRALNRGYGSPRARWPMELGLLNQDSLWVLDEVQLMDTGLASSAQLQQFRETHRDRSLRPALSWWMSATLQPGWLESVDTRALVSDLGAPLSIPPADRLGSLWEVRKTLERRAATSPDEIAALALEAHARLETGPYGRITLVVMNTVDRAVDVHRAILRQRSAAQGETRLVHSRFRGLERSRWRDDFLRRDACTPDADRIVVATQVVEAGVDISAGVLITELAPWPSLVQRFGRAARYGGDARVIVLEPELRDDRAAAPYAREALEHARDLACSALADVSQRSIEDFEAALDAGTRRALYPYAPRHLLMQHEWEALFDTTADLTGADVDVSRFIRSGDERDVQVFWWPIEAGALPPADLRPVRDGLCPVPFLKARDWLCGTETKERPAPRLLASRDAWVWDWIAGSWRRLERRDIYPGQTLLIASRCGGYDPAVGWSPGSSREVPPVDGGRLSAMELADATQDGEDLSASPADGSAWKTIGCHGGEVAEEAARIGEALELPGPVLKALRLAGRWHDLGKAHAAFQGSIRHEDRPARADLAKAPAGAWPADALYRTAEGQERRPGFRHELASALALFAVLERHRPGHPALLGPWEEALRLLDGVTDRGEPLAEVAAATPTEQAILELDARTFDLVAYLVASHHGKVRVGLHAAPADQGYRAADDASPDVRCAELADAAGLPIRGVREGDRLPAVLLEPGLPPLPSLSLTLEPAVTGLSPRTGASWTERVQGLLAQYGPATLALLEACLRAADVRASRLTTRDPLLEGA